MTEAAIVVMNFNGKHLLPECMTSLQAQSVRADVVVVDNGSSDGSAEFIAKHFPEVRLLALEKNLGFAAGYNDALECMPHPWVALLNNDAALAPDWLEELLAVAEREPRAAILGGKLLFRRIGQTGRILQSAGASFTDAGTAFELGWGQADLGQYDQAARVGAISGAAMLVQRKVFLELGGFDAAYFAYLEDVDLCWRAWLAGHEVLYWPGAVALHRFGATAGGRAAPFRIRWMQRNRLANMAKNLELASLPKAVAISLAYDAYRVLEYSGRRQFGALKALAAGTLAFWKDLQLILARRSLIQRSRIIRDRVLREKRLLVPALTAFREYRRLDRLRPS